MIAEAGNVIRHAILITGFVFIIMLVMEYINVQTKGLWRTRFLGNGWKQYILAALLGVITGCLGAFTAVSLFLHRKIIVGTHPIPQKYFTIHSKLGTWESQDLSDLTKPTLANTKTRLLYD